MDRRARLIDDGWTECLRCEDLEGCDDCLDGLVPPVGMIEAGARAIWQRRHNVPYRPGRARHNEYHDDYLRDAQALLMEAERWAAKQP